MAEQSDKSNNPRLCKDCSARIIDPPYVTAPYLQDHCLECHKKHWTGALPVRSRQFDTDLQGLSSEAASNTEDPNAETKQVWTKADDLARDQEIQRLIEDRLEEWKEIFKNEDKVARGRVQSHFDYMDLLRRALDSDSPVLRMNLDAVAYAMFQTSHRIDESKTQPHGPDDPEVDVFTTRDAKFEFTKWLVSKAKKFEVKEMENLIVYVKGVVESMDEYYYSVRRRAGFRGEPEEELCRGKVEKEDLTGELAGKDEGEAELEESSGL